MRWKIREFITISSQRFMGVLVRSSDIIAKNIISRGVSTHIRCDWKVIAFDIIKSTYNLTQPNNIQDGDALGSVNRQQRMFTNIITKRSKRKSMG